MTKKLIYVTTVMFTFLGIAALTSSIAMGPVARSRAEVSASQGIAAPTPLPSPAPVPGRLGFVVDVNPDLPHKELARTVADQLRAANPLPPVRLARFGYLDDPSVRVDGWHGRVESVAPTPRGWVATVGVGPCVTTTFGASTTILDQILETYEFANGELRFLGAVDAPGASPGSFIVD